MSRYLMPRDERGRFVSPRDLDPIERAVRLVGRIGHHCAPRRGRHTHGRDLVTLALLAVLAVILVGCALVYVAGRGVVRFAGRRAEVRRGRHAERTEAERQAEQTRAGELVALERAAPGWATWCAREGMPDSAQVWQAIADGEHHREPYPLPDAA